MPRAQQTFSFLFLLLPCPGSQLYISRRLLTDAAERLKLSARGYTRVLRVARTIADLEGSTGIGRPHIAEALGYRRRAGLN